MKDHEYTWETIYHFNCGECMNWWSYASTLEYLKPDTIVRLSCPHCGYRTKVKLKENGTIQHECLDEKVISLKSKNFKIEDEQHWSFLIEDNINKSIEI